MNRIFMALAAIALLTSASPVRVACISDGTSRPASELGAMLGTGYQVQDYSFTNGAIARDNGSCYLYSEVFARVQSYLPDIVTISLGANDKVTDADAFVWDFKALVDGLRKIPSRPAIYLCLNPSLDEDIREATTRTALGRWLEIVEGSDAQAIYNSMNRCGDTGSQGPRILFIGDSITDGDWAKADGKKSIDRNPYDCNHVYGHGYQANCAATLLEKYPQKRFRFYNRGISGDHLSGLVERWDYDVLAVRPDVISIYIGINDTGKENFDIAGWEKMYRDILDRSLEANPSVKFVLCTPFIRDMAAIHIYGNYELRESQVLAQKKVILSLAKEYGATAVLFDEVIDKCIRSDRSGNIKYWVWDGIHPTYPGHVAMAREWMKCTRKLF